MGVVVRQKIKGRSQPWWVFINHNGQRKSLKVGDKSAAETVGSKIRAEIKQGQFGLKLEKAISTFGEYEDSWIKTIVSATCRASTVRDYKDILRIHVHPVFQALIISDITHGMVNDFLLDKINEGYAESTVGHLKDVVSGILNKASDDEIITTNPTTKLGEKIKRKDKKSINQSAFHR